MAKKAAKKSTAEKPAKKDKSKPVAVAKATKETKAKESKSSDKSAKKATVAKASKAPKLTVVSKSEDSTDTVVGIGAESENTKSTKKAPKPEKLTAAQKKAERLSAEVSSQWADLQLKYSSEKPQVYDMKAQFEAHKPLQHKVLGWGWIMSVENDRLEVIFQDGKRMLISNYKSR